MYKWFKGCICDLRSVSDQLIARGSPCAKGYHSSASQWLYGEQVRLCSAHTFWNHSGRFLWVEVEGVCTEKGGGGVLLAPWLNDIGTSHPLLDARNSARKEQTGNSSIERAQRLNHYQPVTARTEARVDLFVGPLATKAVNSWRMRRKL